MDALPLPPRPDLEQYRKRAKELRRAVDSREPGAVRTWADHWIGTLVRRSGVPLTPLVQGSVDRAVAAIESSVREAASRPFGLADAQLLLARAHGFRSWPRFVEHVRGVTRDRSPVARFEAAVDAVVAGDLATLERSLGEKPELVLARSTRAHRATLLHYVSANGVEDYRQKSPRNAVAVAALLLDAGAEVDAECDAYAGGSTTLALVASSIHPRRAGVQEQLLALLLDRGADLEHRTPGGHSALTAAIFNGQGAAAAFLASRGARLDLTSASAVGRRDVVRSCFDEDGSLRSPSTAAGLQGGLHLACQYGHRDVVAFLLEHGGDLAVQDRHGQSALHHATLGGHLEVVRLLLARGAPLELRNVWGGTVLGLATWCVMNQRPGPEYVEVVRALLEAGARVEEADYPTGRADVDELLRQHGGGGAARVPER